MARRHRRPTFASIIHKDATGTRVGHSERNILGGYVDYDRHGRIIGQTSSDHHGGYTHYDTWGNFTGHSKQNEYIHNPEDDFFKTGSYNPKK